MGNYFFLHVEGFSKEKLLKKHAFSEHIIPYVYARNSQHLICLKHNL